MADCGRIGDKEEMATHVHVVTRPVDSDEPGKHIIIDHDNSEHRQWMAKHCWWAMRSGHVVTSYPTNEPITFVAKRSREHA